MNGDLSKARDSFIEGLGHLVSTMGLSRVIGQLYAMLFLSREPLCLDDMAERLRISKGNASVNIRELEKLRIVRKVWVKGSRKDYYEAELDLDKLIGNAIVGAVKRRMDMVVETVTGTEKLIQKTKRMNKEQKKIAELYLSRLRRVKEIRELAQEMLNSVSYSLKTICTGHRGIINGLGSPGIPEQEKTGANG